MKKTILGTLCLTSSLVAAQSVAQEAGIYCSANVEVVAVGPNFNRLLFAPRSGFIQSTETELLILTPFLSPPSSLDPLLMQYLFSLYSSNSEPAEVLQDTRLLDVLLEGQDLGGTAIESLAARRTLNGAYSFFDPQLPIEISQTMRLLEGYRQEIDQSISDLTIVEAQIQRNLNERALLLDIQLQERRLSSILAAPSLYSSQWSLLDNGGEDGPRIPNPTARREAYEQMLGYLDSYFPDLFGTDASRLNNGNALDAELDLASRRRDIELALLEGEASDLMARSERIRQQLEFRRETLQSSISEVVAQIFYDVSALVPCQNCIVQLSNVSSTASFVPAGTLIGRVNDDLSSWSVLFNESFVPENADGIVILPSSAGIASFNLVIDELGERLYVDDKFLPNSWFAYSDLADLTLADNGRRSVVEVKHFNLSGPELEYARTQGALVESYDFSDSAEYLFQNWLENSRSLSVYYHSGGQQCES
ncbi:hypothetical protein [Thalassovita taeanensis]|uniref:Uncharacterized protein n=1 Tax=Thalassovita taeanensis TaxID=657014 RepID=A0A1H9KCZ1_9RHOB|nr:hypothetical protein [Thalassovita taeanensis]SEQ96807.1 hypothetical protein SAMN04488092_11814 [Thalassovita taeanensis]